MAKRAGWSWAKRMTERAAGNRRVIGRPPSGSLPPNAGAHSGTTSDSTMAPPRVRGDVVRMSTCHPDERIREIAARQHGVVGRKQLLAAGVSVGAISHRLKKGTLRPIHKGVYGTGPIPGRYHREMAAVLACGPYAILSDRTAAGIWELMRPPRPEVPVDIAGPRNLRGPTSGVRLHRRGRLGSDEVKHRHGLPLTSPSRTVFDLSSCLGPYELERVLARALRQQLAHPDSVEDLLHRYPHRRGCRTLRKLLEDASGPDLTRSEAEVRFLALLRNGGVPRPRVNSVVSGLEVDFFWPDRGVVVEIDGFAYHSHRSAFEDDRSRDARFTAEGLAVIRFTWRQIDSEPDKVLVRLSMALGAGTRRRASE